MTGKSGQTTGGIGSGGIGSGGGPFEAAPGVRLSPGDLSWNFARSGGPGGQNVNKVATKAELTVPLAALAEQLPGWSLDRLRDIAGKRIADDALRLSSDSSRSQVANRKACLVKLRQLIVEAQHRPKRRKRTRPSRSSIRRRLENKRQRGRIKEQRQEGRGRTDV